jgi:NADPH:quinone reductase-like Zn-dependent oxidoreductase
MTNRALVVDNYGGSDAAKVVPLPIPHPGPGQLLIRVKAAGINGVDWKFREGLIRDKFPLPLPAVLGMEFAGEVVAAPTNSEYSSGDRVFGPMMSLGAFADYIVVDEHVVAPIPLDLSDIIAASLPVSALTARQLMVKLRSEQHVLIHGASGAVGGLVVQLAKRKGLQTTAVTSAKHVDYVRSLGADCVINRDTLQFEQAVDPLDVVLDLAGGDVQERSWSVLKPGGVLYSIVRPNAATQAPIGKRGEWVFLQPNRSDLLAVAQDVAEGSMVSTISKVLSPPELPQAIEQYRFGIGAGKAVVDFTMQ